MAGSTYQPFSLISQLRSTLADLLEERVDENKLAPTLNQTPALKDPQHKRSELARRFKTAFGVRGRLQQAVAKLKRKCFLNIPARKI